MTIFEKQNVEFIQGAILEPVSVIIGNDAKVYTINVPSLSRLRYESAEMESYDVKIDISNPMAVLSHTCPQKQYTPHDIRIIDHHEIAAILVLQREGIINEMIHVTDEQIGAYLNSKDIKMLDREISDLFKEGSNYWEQLSSAQRGIAERSIMNEIFVGIMPKTENILTKLLDKNKEFSGFYKKINATRRWSTLCENYAPRQIMEIDRGEVALARVMSDYELIIGGKLNLKWSQSNVKRLSDVVLGTDYLAKKESLLSILQ